MENEKIDVEKIYNHWLLRSDKDFDTMINLFSSKDYHWALFIGHLVIERLLKAIVVKKTNNHAPLTHDLRKLSKVAELDLTTDQILWLDTISSFNLNARYDNYRQDFYQKCTFEFTNQWISNIQQLRVWIKTML